MHPIVLPTISTTIGIFSPLLALLMLVAAAAYRKGFCAWPVPLRDGSEGRFFAEAYIMRQQVPIHLGALLVSTVFFSILALFQVFRQTEPSTHPLILELIQYGSCLLTSTILTIPAFLVLEKDLFSRVRNQQSMPLACQLANIWVLAIFLMLGIPSFQCFLANFGLNIVSTQTAIDLFFVSCTLSTMPASILGSTIAFTEAKDRHQPDYEYVLQQNPITASDLESKNDKELERLIDCALKAKKIEAADFMSQYLLNRAIGQSSTAYGAVDSIALNIRTAEKQVNQN